MKENNNEFVKLPEGGHVGREANNNFKAAKFDANEINKNISITDRIFYGEKNITPIDILHAEAIKIGPFEDNKKLNEITKSEVEKINNKLESSDSIKEIEPLSKVFQQITKNYFDSFSNFNSNSRFSGEDRHKMEQLKDEMHDVFGKIGEKIYKKLLDACETAKDFSNFRETLSNYNFDSKNYLQPWFDACKTAKDFSNFYDKCGMGNKNILKKWFDACETDNDLQKITHALIREIDGDDADSIEKFITDRMSDLKSLQVNK